METSLSLYKNHKYICFATTMVSAFCDILSDEYTDINWSSNVHYFVLHSSFFSFCAPTCPYSDDAMYLHCVFCLKDTGAGCLFQPIVSPRPSSQCPQGHHEKLREKKVSSKIRTPGKEKRKTGFCPLNFIGLSLAAVEAYTPFCIKNAPRFVRFLFAVS